MVGPDLADQALAPRNPALHHLVGADRHLLGEAKDSEGHRNSKLAPREKTEEAEEPSQRSIHSLRRQLWASGHARLDLPDRPEKHRVVVDLLLDEVADVLGESGRTVEI